MQLSESQSELFSESEHDLLSQGLHQQNRPLVVFDLETSGLSPFVHEIIEIGAVKWADGHIESFHTLVKAKESLTEKNIAIHGITDAMIAQAPDIEEVLPRFFEFIQDCDLWAHNAKFDTGFLLAEAVKLNQSIPKNAVFDTCSLAKSFFKKRKEKPTRFNLSSLASFYNIEFQHHRAMNDAVATMKVLLNIFKDQKQKEVERLREKSYEFELQLQDAHHKKIKEYPFYSTIQESIQNHSTIYIRYSGGSHGRKLRPVHPLACLPLPKGYHLYATCLLSDHHKAFNLDKISEIIKAEDYDKQEVT